MELDNIETSKLGLDDFSNGEGSGGAVLQEKSVQSISAMKTMELGEVSEGAYDSIKDNLMSPETRKKFILDEHIRRETILTDMRKDISDMLADPAIDESAKRVAVSALGATEVELDKTDADLFTDKALIADSDSNETEAASDSRFNAIEVIKGVNAKKLKLQQLVENVNLDIGGVGGVLGDLGELIVPFAEQLAQNDINEEFGVEGSIFGGENRAAFEKFYDELPLDKKVEIGQKLVDVISQQGVVIQDTNALFALDRLETTLLDGDYGWFARGVDTVASLLDVVGIGFTAKGLLKGTTVGAKATRLTAKAAEVAKARNAKTTVKAGSPAELAKDVNPELARKMQIAALEDKTGKASEALYGTNTADALAHNMLGEVDTANGVVKHKVKMEGPQKTGPQENKGPQFNEYLKIREARENNGGTALTLEEYKAVKDRYIAGADDIVGMKIHAESLLIGEDKAGRLTITAKYSPRDSGFDTPEEAVENALHSFRRYGLEEKDLIIYERVGDELIPSSFKDIKAKNILRAKAAKKGKKLPDSFKTIDYSIGIKSTYDIDAGAVVKDGFEVFDVHYSNTLGLGKLTSSNIFGQGTINQHVFDSGSMFDKRFVNPAFASNDRGVALKKQYTIRLNQFGDELLSLPKQRQLVVNDYINTAMERKIRFDPIALAAQGFDVKEVNLLRRWRKINDTMWYASNADQVKNLRLKGFNVFTQNGGNTKLYTRSLKEGAINKSTRMFDPESGKVISMDKDEVSKLYRSNKDADVQRTSEPFEVDGEWVEAVVNRNTTKGGFVRAMRHDEVVMPYQDGYYPTKYDANFFIRKKETLSGGGTRWKTIATAKTTKDKDALLAKLSKEDSEGVYDFVDDGRSTAEKLNEFSEHGWSLTSNSGMSSQKLRGERLMDAGVDLHSLDRANLVDPMEAVSQQVLTLSSKISMRDWFETSKARFMDNYADSLTLPKDDFGELTYPARVGQITSKAGTSEKTLQDARNTFNYIYANESAWISQIDVGWKALMNHGADMLGKAGLSNVDAGLRTAAKNASLSGSVKGAAFKMFLAWNPLRQLVIQSHQSVQIAAINPVYAATGLWSDAYQMSKYSLGMKVDPKYVELAKELEKSGMLDAVDQNILVRNELKNIKVEQSGAIGAVKSSIAKVAGIPQRVGFDAGERMVLRTSWLTHRDMAIKAGKTLNARTYAEIAGDARAFTFGMNKAGDMPYSKNDLSVLAQFMVVPHKAALQMFTNRNLTKAQRGQLIAFNMVAYGIPAVVLPDWFYENIEEGAVRDGIEHGFEGVLFNKMISEFSGEETRIDWSDLSPIEGYGMRDVVLDIITSGFNEMFAKSPSGSLFFGGNSRITNAFNKGLQWAGIRDDYEDPELSVKLTDVSLAFMNLSSGFSNAFKAAYQFETGKAISGVGTVLDEDVNKWEAGAKLFGLSTMQTSGLRKAGEESFGRSDYEAGDVKLWYDELKRHLLARGQDPKTSDMQMRILQEAQRVFQNDPISFRKEIFNLVNKDNTNGDTRFIQGIITNMGIKTADDLRDIINKHDNPVIRKQLLDWLEHTESLGKK